MLFIGLVKGNMGPMWSPLWQILKRQVLVIFCLYFFYCFVEYRGKLVFRARSHGKNGQRTCYEVATLLHSCWCCSKAAWPAWDKASGSDAAGKPPAVPTLSFDETRKRGVEYLASSIWYYGCKTVSSVCYVVRLSRNSCLIWRGASSARGGNIFIYLCRG